MLVRKMTEDEALRSVAVFLKQSTKVKRANPSEPENIAEWTATYNGKRVRFYATREIKLSIVYGSSIAMQEE